MGLAGVVEKLTSNIQKDSKTMRMRNRVPGIALSRPYEPGESDARRAWLRSELNVQRAQQWPLHK